MQEADNYMYIIDGFENMSKSIANSFEMSKKSSNFAAQKGCKELFRSKITQNEPKLTSIKSLKTQSYEQFIYLQRDSSAAGNVA